MIKVPFNDLGWQWNQIAEAALPDIENLMSRAEYCLGPAVASFEADFARHFGYAHVIGVSSGTAALHLAVTALGLKPGDGVLIPAMTFAATAWAPLYVGARPVLCDVNPDTAEIDLDDAARRIDTTVRAIMPVHIYGQPANMERVMAFAAAYDLIVIEDAAQAVGARSGDRAIGGHGAAAGFSFYPGKNLGAAGEAGAVVTASNDVARRVRALRDHGQFARYTHSTIGFNYRMDGLQALVLAHKLRHLDDWTRQRRALAAVYSTELSDLPLVLPEIVNGDHVWHLYVVRTARRDALQAFLSERQIATGRHYPIPLNRQPALADYAGDGRFPVADQWAEQGLSLPLFAGMTPEQQAAVITAVRDFFA